MKSLVVMAEHELRAARGGGLMADLSTEVLVVGSEAGGAFTAARWPRRARQSWCSRKAWSRSRRLSRSRSPRWSPSTAHGASAAIGNPFIAYAEGRCVGGGTEINSELYHRLPEHLAAEEVAGPLRHRRVHAPRAG